MDIDEADNKIGFMFSINEKNKDVFTIYIEKIKDRL